VVVASLIYPLPLSFLEGPLHQDFSLRPEKLTPSRSLSRRLPSSEVHTHATLPFLARFSVFLFSHRQILLSAGFWSIEFIHRFICLHRMPGISVAHVKSVDALLGSVTPFGEKRALVPGALAACVSCVSVRRLPCPGHSRRGWLAPTHEALAHGC
jgi:hypothetical protein